MNNEQIFRNGSVTYYYSSLFFKGQVKQDVFTLYAYVRTIDDLVDSIPADVKQFEYMWHQTRYAWKHETSENRIVKKFYFSRKTKTF
jgi:phytoene synthase